MGLRPKKPYYDAIHASTTMLSPEQDLVAVFLERFSAENTQAAYRQDLTHFFGVLGTSRPNLKVVRTIKPDDVNTWIRHMEREYHPSTVSRRLSAVKSFFDWLIATEALSANPAHPKVIRKSRVVRSSDRPIFSLTRKQASQLIHAADNPRDHAMISVLLYCMLRRSEVAAMNVEDLGETDGHPILRLPQAKGGTNQYVKIPKPAHDALMAHLHANGITSGAIWRSLSNRNTGERITPKTIYNVVNALSARSGLRRIHPHILRHTGCTLAIDAGASVMAVRAHARHRSINTTMNYIHQRERLDKSAGDFIDLEGD